VIIIIEGNNCTAFMLQSHGDTDIETKYTPVHIATLPPIVQQHISELTKNATGLTAEQFDASLWWIPLEYVIESDADVAKRMLSRVAVRMRTNSDQQHRCWIDTQWLRLLHALQNDVDDVQMLKPVYDILSAAKRTSGDSSRWRSKNRLLRILRGGPVTADDRLLLLEARRIYPLVFRDSRGQSRKPFADIDDYLRSCAWLKKFRNPKGGRTREIPAEYLALRLAYSFEQLAGRPNWSTIAKIVLRAFPGALQPPNEEEYSLGAWAQKFAKRYASWNQQFRSKKTNLNGKRRLASKLSAGSLHG